MLKYKPKRNTKTAVKAIVFMILILVCIAVVSALKIGREIINQSLVFAVSAGILYILMRYVIYEYTYVLGEDTVSVSRVAGRVPAEIVNLNISGDDLFIRAGSKKELKALGVKRFENVCANLSPREGMYAYITTVRDQKTAILFEADELFALAVNERINIRKMTGKAEKSAEGEL